MPATMAPRARRSIGRLILALALLLPGVAAVPTASAASGYALDLAGRNDFVAQTNFVQCVGASMQMMLNMIRPTNDRTAATQLELQVLARSLSGRRGNPADNTGTASTTQNQRRGASVRGWTAGLNQLGAGPYRLVGLTTLEDAMQLAAKSIRETKRPVGLLVWRGRHAWVMSGFHATADPLLTDDFEVTAAIVMDPLYPYGSASWGPSPEPREALSPEELGRQFVPRRQSSFASTLGGKYVLVLPFTPIEVARGGRLAA